MKKLILVTLLFLAGCQSTPNIQPPLLTQEIPMIIIRHNGGVQDGACPMWVKIDGVMKGEIENGRSLAIDVAPGIRTVSVGRSRNGVFGAGTVCWGNLQTIALATRSVEVGSSPFKVVYTMEGTGKRWIPIAGLFLAPTPALNPDN